MKRFFAFLLWIFIATCPAIAVDTDDGGDVYYPENIICKSASAVHKCAKLPDYEYFTLPNGTVAVSGDYVGNYSFADPIATDNDNWTHIRNGVLVRGYAELVNSNQIGPYYFYSLNCHTTYPFSVTYYAEYRISASEEVNHAYVCANIAAYDEGYSEVGNILSVPVAPDGDTCPDGFFTVPWESWCGDGMVNVADVPNCDDDVSGDYCLMSAAVAPCAAGVTKIRTSTGLSFSLWAEKSTEPSLCIKYGDVVCYGNLATGRATDTINIEYNNQIYHLVD